MYASEFNTRILQPAMDCLTPLVGIPRSREADLILLAIAGQESSWRHTYQVLNTPGLKGPARGYWQFEKNGGVAGVMRHPSTEARARELAQARGHPWDRALLWGALETDSTLAAGFARLLLWTDPRPLPTNQAAGWKYYIRNWRPGKPHPSKWPSLWEQAENALQEKET